METIVKNKSFEFSILIIHAYKKLNTVKKEYILSKQFLRSGTAIGALIWEAQKAESKKDFIHKMSIELKEANETAYWIELLYRTHYYTLDQKQNLYSECDQLIRILVTIIKSTKRNLKS